MEILRNTLEPTAWDAFVHAQPGGTYAQLCGWQEVISQAYGQQPIALAAVAGDSVGGILPLVLVRSRLFGSELVSMPYLDIGGSLALSTEIDELLLESARQIALASGVALCIRSDRCIGRGEAVDENRAQMRLGLDADENRLLARIPSERRNRIRKAMRRGLAADVGGSELLPSFFAVYTRNMRDLGSPPHSRVFFAAVLQRFAPSAGIIAVRDDRGAVLGAGLYIRHGDVLSLPWVSSLRSAFSLNPNLLLYWELMRWGISQGCTVFDFGRSTRGTGTYEFKRQWGAIEHPLYWHYWGPGASKRAGLTKEAGGYRLLTRLWSKLPLGLATAIGNRIRGGITL